MIKSAAVSIQPYFPVCEGSVTAIYRGLSEKEGQSPFFRVPQVNISGKETEKTGLAVEDSC